ncbi:pentapeptide repeat-containing protein [Neisseria mucosa]|uniref:pentapeptide repeat-containing protein n=1 Tax=Neisseria mucosa TaxID=488 RepID=UPI0019248A76|nr:pentapeptide repeat-containing protein [Neisseria mucosa]
MGNNDMQIDEETFLSILKEHQLWVNSNGQSGKRADLSGQDFSGISFRYYAYLLSASPWTVNLRFAILKGINFSHADLSEANLEAVNLIEGNLNGANLKRAILSKAKMINAHLSGANLRGADLTGTDLTGADLTGANLTGAELRGANLTRANLTRANLIGTDLTGADLGGAILSEVILDKEITDLFEASHLDFTQFIAPVGSYSDNLRKKFQSSEATIRELEEKLKQAQQAQSETVKNDEEITKLNEQLNLEKSEKQKITEKLEELNNLLNKRKEELRGRIKDAQKSLSEALKNTDKQIKNNENTARLFKWLGIVLFGMSIFLLINFGSFVVCLPELFVEKKLNILFYTFPIITLMLIGTTCLRHQKNLLAEVRHFSNMKHQIELYSGLLEASQHAAASFDNPEKANEYVQETFTQIRNRLLNSQYLPDNSSADKQSDNDFGSDKVLDLLNKIADLSGKKSMGN